MTKTPAPCSPPLVVGLLALGVSGCVLDPKGVGGDDPDDETIGDDGPASSSGDGSGTDPTAADEHAEEIAVRWDEVFPYAMAKTPDGDVVAALGSVDGATFLSRFDEAGEQWNLSLTDAYVDVVYVTASGNIVAGGSNVHVTGGMVTSLARLWIFDPDGMLLAEHEVEGDFATVTSIHEADGALWTLTERRGPGGGPPIVGVLRRHGLDGAAAATIELDDEASRLATGSTDALYVVGARYVDTPGQVMRVEFDGTRDWTTPIEGSPSWRTEIFASEALGVVVASPDVAGLLVETIRADGSDGSSWSVAGAAAGSQRAVVDVAGDAITFAWGTGSDGLHVESRLGDGTVAWTAERTFDDVTEVEVRSVRMMPTSVLVAGALTPGPGGTPQGFVRYVPSP